MSDAEEAPDPCWIFDVRGLRAWANVSANEAAVIEGVVSSGKIKVYNRIWREFCEAYPDEAAQLSAGPGLRVTQEHRDMTVVIANQSHAHGSNGMDDACDYAAAGIATVENATVITTSRRIADFYRPLGVDAVTIDDVLRHTEE